MSIWLAQHITSCCLHAEGATAGAKDKRHAAFSEGQQKKSSLTQAALNRANSMAPTAKNLVKWAAQESSSAGPMHAAGAVQKRSSRESMLSENSSRSSANTGKRTVSRGMLQHVMLICTGVGNLTDRPMAIHCAHDMYVYV